MAARTETVRLTLDDDFSSKMARVAATTALAQKELKNLNGTAVNSSGFKNVERDAAAAGREVDKTSNAFTKGEASIDRYSGRLSLIAQAAVTIGPALIPLTAGAIPAIAGLTAGLGAAAGAFGVTLLAVHGLGDGLKALDAYQLEPTATSLKKMQDEMKELGPAGAEFVKYLDKLEPDLKSIQESAREGLFPGVESGIESLMQRLPQVRDIVGNIGGALGDLARATGKELGGPKFDAFFTYLQNEAGPILHDFGHAALNVGEGLANLLVAFNPASQSFTRGLLGMTQAFAQWSRHLSSDQGFQQFLAYVQENGPKTVAFFESLVNALAAVVEAAAPIGGVVLPALTDILNVVADIAKSDIGTPIFAAAAALSVLNRALAVTAALKTGALSTSPWAAFAAVAVGEVVAVKHANDDLKASIESVQIAINSMDFSAYTAGLADVRAQIEATAGDSSKNRLISGFASALPGVGSFFASKSQEQDKGTAEAAQQYAELQKQMLASQQAAAGLAVAFGQVPPPLDGSAKSATALTHVMEMAAPAMQKAGITAEDLTNALLRQSNTHSILVGSLNRVQPSYAGLVSQIKATADAMSSLPGRTKAVDSAISGLGNEMLTTQQKASDLQQALDNLLSPGENLSAATDAWNASLRHLDTSLDKHNKTLTQQNDAGDKNRAVIRGQVDNLKALLVAQAANGAGTQKLTHTLESQRAALIAAGVAAGLSKAQLRDYLHQLGLTPKLVRTVVQADTHQAQSAVAALKSLLDSLHDRNIHVNVTKSTNANIAEADVLHAAGGYIRGPGTTTSDSIPALLSDREYVVKAAAVDKYGVNLFHRLNAMTFAGGGSVGGSSGDLPFTSYGNSDASYGAWAGVMAEFSFHTKKAGKALEHELKVRERLLNNAIKLDQKAVDRDQKEADAERQRLQNLQDERKQLVDAVAGRFAPSLGNVQTPDSLLPTINVQSAPADGAIAETSERSQIMGRLRARGVPVRLLIALAGASIEQLRVLDKFGDEQLTAYEQKYASNVAGAGPLGGLQKQLADAKTFLALLKELKAEGLTGAALADAAKSGSLSQLQSLAGLGVSGIADYTTTFNQTAQIAQQAGVLVGNDNFAAAIAKQTIVTQAAVAELQAAKAELMQMKVLLQGNEKQQKTAEKHLSEIEKAAKKNAHDTSTPIVAAIKGTVSNGQRRK